MYANYTTYFLWGNFILSTLIDEHITLSCKNNAQKLPQVLLDTEDPGLSIKLISYVLRYRLSASLISLSANSNWKLKPVIHN